MALPIPTSIIDENPYQPRQHYDQSELDTLADDIAANGLLQPPPARVVDPDGEPVEVPAVYDSPKAISLFWEERPECRVQLAFGHRRLRAITQLDMAEMELRLSALSDDRMDMMAWSENKKRADLTPLEEAQAIADRIERHGWTQMEAAEALGIARSTVANKLRLLKLPENVQRIIRRGGVTERQARALVPAYDLTEDEQRLVSDANTMSHPGNILTMARNGESSDAIRRAVGKMRDVIDEEREAQRVPEGWRLEKTPPPEKTISPSYRAVRHEDGEKTDEYRMRRKAAEAARSLVEEAQRLERYDSSHAPADTRSGAEIVADEDASMSEKDISEMSATEAAERLRERHGIGVTIQRGTEDLRRALHAAEAEAGKEQPQDAAALEERLECMPGGLYAEQGGPDDLTVSEIQAGLGQVKSLLRDLDRRDTWVRGAYQPDSPTLHGLLKAKYRRELDTLSKLRERAKAVQAEMRAEWLPEAQAAGEEQGGEKAKSAAPSGDAMPEEAQTVEVDGRKVEMHKLKAMRGQLDGFADRLDALFVALDELHEDMNDAGGLASGYVKSARQWVRAAEEKIDAWQADLPSTEEEQPDENEAAAAVRPQPPEHFRDPDTVDLFTGEPG